MFEFMVLILANDFSC